MLSVIIATHKRASILQQCLAYLSRQTVAVQLEVIVVCDGHDAETHALKDAVYPFALFVYDIEKSQQAVARNFGVSKAIGQYVLFINDDIFLESTACEVHIQALQSWNAKKPTAILGFTTWDPAVSINKTMRFLESSGWQFGYPFIAQYANRALPCHIQSNFTYSSHCSLPLQLAKQHSFNSQVRVYGWEDIEWGQRLAEAGIQLVYKPSAVGLHHHHISYEESLKRMHTIGRSAVSMERIAPGLKLVPKGLKKVYYFCASYMPTLSGRHRRAFLRGIHDAMHSNVAHV